MHFLTFHAIPDTNFSSITAVRHLQTSGIFRVCVQIGFPFASVKEKRQRNKIPLFFQNATATFSRKLQTYDSENSFPPFPDPTIERHDVARD